MIKPVEHKHAKLTGAQMKTSFCLSWPNSFFYQLHYTMHLNHLNIWCINLQHIISMYNAKLPTLHRTFYKLQLFPDCGKFHNLSARLLTVKECFVKKKLLYFMCWEKGWERKTRSVRATGSKQHGLKSTPLPCYIPHSSEGTSQITKFKPNSAMSGSRQDNKHCRWF